jgi:hypothetical protein
MLLLEVRGENICTGGKGGEERERRKDRKRRRAKKM